MSEIDAQKCEKSPAILTLYNVGSVRRGMFSTSGDVQYIGPQLYVDGSVEKLWFMIVDIVKNFNWSSRGFLHPPQVNQRIKS